MGSDKGGGESANASFGLPILAFRLNGANEHIALEIDEVFGYPLEISYGGGYGIRGTISISSGQCYRVDAACYCTTGELYRFYQSLKVCYDSLSGCACFESIEDELRLSCQFDRTGHVLVSGAFQQHTAFSNVLRFEFPTDQTQVRDTLSMLTRLHGVFGDQNGVPRE